MSNNDGCIVARSNEAKALGIKMGQPVFEIRDLVRAGTVIAISGHHLLYRDISLKVHDIFRRFVPAAIDYSIDEAFLDVKGIPLEMLHDIGLGICKACREEVHIPVTIGFAKTKTLSKIITDACKKKRVEVGILTDKDETLQLLRQLPISELWGIGRRLSKRLYQAGIFTIADFAARNRGWVRSNLGVTGERSWLELHGVKCIELSHVERTLQDSISETRTFPEDVSDYDYLRARIAIYGADCARKLRAMRGCCNYVTVFLRTNRFHPEKGVYCPELTLTLRKPTDETTEIVDAGVCALDRIFSPSAAYKRAGIILSGIMPADSRVGSLFDNDMLSGEGQGRENMSQLLKTVDKLNKDIGAPKLKLASQLTKGHPGHNDGYSSSFQAPSK